MGRPSRGDLAVAVGMAVVAWTTGAFVPAPEPYRSYDWLGAVLAGFAAATLLWRRSHHGVSVEE